MNNYVDTLPLLGPLEAALLGQPVAGREGPLAAAVSWAAAADVMGIPFLGRIPLRMAIRQASDTGRPPAAGEGEDSDIFRGLAVALLEQVKEAANAA